MAEENGSVYEADQSLPFAADAIAGRPGAPFALTSKCRWRTPACRRPVMSPAFPNPARNGASPVIRFGLPRAEHVTLRLYDVSGRLVQTLVDGRRVAGWHDVALDTGALSSGVYFYRMVAGAFHRADKIAIVR